MNFKYCDPPTIEAESVNSSLNRHTTEAMHDRVYHNATIMTFREGISDRIVGEIFESDGTKTLDTNSNIDYSDAAPRCYRIVPEKFLEEVIYLGCISSCWGHYITDGLAKAWFFMSEEGKLLISRGVPVVMTTRYENRVKAPVAFQSVFDELGLEIKIQIINEPTQVGIIHCPTNSLFIRDGTRYFTNEFNSVVNRLLQPMANSRCVTIYPKVYLSRTHLTNKNAEFGERQIERAFRNAGFKVIYPETLSFQDQVRIIYNASEIATTEGSIAHNLIFAKPHTKAIILRKAFYTNDYQYVINRMRDLDVLYVDVHLSVFTNSQPNLGPFFIYINDNLVQYFKECRGISLSNNFSRRKFQRFILLCYNKNDLFERRSSDIPQWYFDKVTEELKRNASPIKKTVQNLMNLMPSSSSNRLKKIAYRFIR